MNLVTIPCERCGIAVTRYRSQMKKATYCSKPCTYAARRQDIVVQRRARFLPSHPLATATGYVYEHRLILYASIGPGAHPCHWCGKVVRWETTYGRGKDSLVADHVNGNEFDNRIENLVPACQGCNGTRWNQITDDEDFLIRRNGRKERAQRRVCDQCNTVFLALRYTSIRFCSRPCYYASRRKPADGHEYASR